ncbi:MAG TPA: hypothetical protein VHC72_06840 [Bryobacteraceae bacterium]|nr:hypothetical protein [Bryobacteraceae bacterium]
MKKICRNLIFVGLSGWLGSFASAATMTLAGTISDSACGASHAKMMEMHKNPKMKMSERDCTLACVKNGGKFVFVADGKVYNVANQNFPALAQYAGESVSLTGNVQGNTVTVSKVAAK